MSHRTENAQKIIDNFRKKITRQSALSFSICAHCGMCTDSCHYYLATGDPKLAPAYKADKVRKLFKRHVDYNPLGKLFPGWIGAKTLTTDADLEELKDVVFGSCTMCRRCTMSCPLGVDKALLIRTGRAMLTEAGLAPQGVKDVSKDQWEIGNQMGVTPEDYLETIEWLNEELQAETEDPKAELPIDRPNPEFVYVINPREVKYDPRPLIAAAKVMYAAGARWTLPSAGWDNTNFGLFSGDNALGGHMGALVFENVMRLGAKLLVISECGHGFRATKWESPNWAKAKLSRPIDFKIESFLETMVRWVKTGRIKLDKSKNTKSVTYHDPCNLGRSSGLTEEPRFLLQQACMDFREMYPNRADNFCCTGGGGAMSMAEYSKRRLESAKPKAEQLKTTGAEIVITACHNCIDGLSDLIKHYKLGMQVQVVSEQVATALILDRSKIVDVPQAAAKGKGEKILVVDDEKDVTTFLEALLTDNGFTVISTNDPTSVMQLIEKEKPDLITLDVAMPKKSGAVVYRELRTTAATKKLPVVIISGVNPKDYPEYDFRKFIYERELPMPDGFVDKPVDEKQLMLAVRKIFDLRAKASAH
jgi:Fe-S oxidoreductase